MITDENVAAIYGDVLGKAGRDCELVVVAAGEESKSAVAEYKEVLAAINERKLDSNIHIKVTHMGLNLDKEFCYENVRELLTHAQELGNFIRLDMEDSPSVDGTLDLY